MEVVAEVVVVAVVEATAVTALVAGDVMTDMIAMITDQDHLIGGFSAMSVFICPHSFQFHSLKVEMLMLIT